MFRILAYVNARRARREAQMALEKFGDRYLDYTTTTAALIPPYTNTHAVSEG
jgi:protein-S-isoprenylcysteine O-methyltransferase Ste14